MPALNFKKQFATDVELGRKRQTIRTYRKDGRDPKPGDQLYLYTGMRAKSCRKLMEAECDAAIPITIDNFGFVSLASNQLDIDSIIALAEADGFDTAAKFFRFFKETHGFPFYGLLIRWGAVE